MAILCVIFNKQWCSGRIVIAICGRVAIVPQKATECRGHARMCGRALGHVWPDLAPNGRRIDDTRRAERIETLHRHGHAIGLGVCERLHSAVPFSLSGKADIARSEHVSDTDYQLESSALGIGAANGPDGNRASDVCVGWPALTVDRAIAKKSLATTDRKGRQVYAGSWLSTMTDQRQQA